MPADNERFGATAAGSADLKGSAGMPPLPPSRHPVGCKQNESVVILRKRKKSKKNLPKSINVIKKVYLCAFF